MVDGLKELADRFSGKELVRGGETFTLFRGQTIIFGRAPWDDSKLGSLAERRNWGMVRKVGLVGEEKDKKDLELLSRAAVALTITLNGRLLAEALSGSNILNLWDREKTEGPWRVNPLVLGVDSQPAGKGATIDIGLGKILGKLVKVRVESTVEERALDGTLRSVTFDWKMNPSGNPGH